MNYSASPFTGKFPLFAHTHTHMHACTQMWLACKERASGRNWIGKVQNKAKSSSRIFMASLPASINSGNCSFLFFNYLCLVKCVIYFYSQIEMSKEAKKWHTGTAAISATIRTHWPESYWLFPWNGINHSSTWASYHLYSLPSGRHITWYVMKTNMQ